MTISGEQQQIIDRKKVRTAVLGIVSWTMCGVASAEVDPLTTFEDYYNIKHEAMGILSSQPTTQQESLPFFEAILPPNLNEKNSFVLTAERGAGKTSLWRYLKNKLLQDSSCLIVEPIRNPSWLQGALENFIKNTRVRSAADDAAWIAQSWQNDDMMDFVISRVVYDVLGNINRLDFTKLDPKERKKFFAVTCFYCPTGTGPAPDDLRKIVKNDLSFWWSLKLEDVNSISEGNINYQYLLRMSEKIVVFDKMSTIRIRMLCKMLEYFKVSPGNLISDPMNRKDILQEYLEIIKKSGLNVVLTLDGIDEVPMFGILNDKCSAAPFMSVIQSTKPLLDMATLQLVHMIMFVPDCPGTDTKKILPQWRTEKIHHFSIKWGKSYLSDYASFILNFFRSQQGWIWGHKLPESFTEFVGGDKCIKLFLDKISYPRQFNELLATFIEQLNQEKNAPGTQFPFVGAQSCSTVEKALAEIWKKPEPEKKLNPHGEPELHDRELEL